MQTKGKWGNGAEVPQAPEDRGHPGCEGLQAAETDRGKGKTWQTPEPPQLPLEAGRTSITAMMGDLREWAGKVTWSLSGKRRGFGLCVKTPFLLP